MTRGLKDNAEVACCASGSQWWKPNSGAVRAERDRLAAQVERLRVDNQRLQTRVGELAAQVEELRRAGKRQAAPLSKNTPTPLPQTAGPQGGRGLRPARATARPPSPTGSTGRSP